jgi:L-iditol 2-dehydrogenase
MIPKTMKACQLVAFNQNEMREVPVPEPQEGEVLCKIRAIAICGTDPEIIHGKLKQRMNWPPQFPFTLGHEWSGEVVKLGPGVKGFKVGDRVAGEAHRGCGSCANCMTGNYTLCLNYGDVSSGHRHYGFVTQGANAEYNVYSTKALRHIPDSLSFRHAALLDTAGVALHGIDMIGVTPGGTAAIWGPGAIGLMSLQMIKAMGAKTIIVVGRQHRLKMAGELGATHLVDYEKCDPVKEVLAITGGVGVDEIQECSGASVALDQCLAAVRKGGKINMLGFYDDPEVVLPPITKIVMNEITITGSRANPNVSNRVLNMFAAGLIAGDKVVTHAFPLEKYNEALDTFLTRKGGAIKVVVEPFPA